MIKKYSFVVVSLLGCLLLLYGFSTIRTQKNVEIINATTTHKLTEQEQFSFADTRAMYLQIASEETPRVALEQLKRDSEQDALLAEHCHDITHEIGHAAFDRYGDFTEAMKFKIDMCNSGYVHGVIEKYFTKDVDIYSSLPTLCNEYADGSYLAWECYHGIGHGLMYFTLNDLPQSLLYCDLLSNDFQRHSCANGVFMENAASGKEVHLSNYVKEDDYWFPCDDHAADYKNECLIYVAIG